MLIGPKSCDIKIKIMTLTGKINVQLPTSVEYVTWHCYTMLDYKHKYLYIRYYILLYSMLCYTVLTIYKRPRVTFLA